MTRSTIVAYSALLYHDGAGLRTIMIDLKSHSLCYSVNVNSVLSMLDGGTPAYDRTACGRLRAGHQLLLTIVILTRQSPAGICLLDQIAESFYCSIFTLSGYFVFHQPVWICRGGSHNLSCEGSRGVQCFRRVFIPKLDNCCQYFKVATVTTCLVVSSI